MKIVHITGRCCLYVLFLVGLLASTGCSVATGNMLTFFPQRDALHPDADNARQAAAAQGVLPIARELNKSVTPLYIVEPGDAILVQPADFDSPVIFPPDQTVLLDGTVHLGKYGLLVVAGKTIPEIEAMVRAAVATHHKEDMGPIMVRIIVPDSKVFYVLGEVNMPGAYPLRGRETVLDGIIIAGGLGPRASHNKIILSRPTPPHGCRIVLPICYDHIVQLGDTTTNYQLRPGDRIFVASRTMFEDLFHHHKWDICPLSPQHPCEFQSTDCAAAPASWHSTDGPVPTIGTPATLPAPEQSPLPLPKPEH